MSNYKNLDTKKWGPEESTYSQMGEYRSCRDMLERMPLIAPKHVPSLWRDVAFVSDGTCGSACALFLQGIQLSGVATGFTYGGVANTAMDVAAFAGGNVESYENFWPKMAFASRVGHLATIGEARWCLAQ